MPENREKLVKYRLESAKERLNSAKILLECGSYKGSIGRSYYAMFTAVRALLARDGIDYSDFFIVSQSDANGQCEKAKEFLHMIESYLQNREHN